MAVTVDAPTKEFKLMKINDDEYHVFITYNHSEEDDRNFAEKLAIDTLKNDHGFKVYLQPRDSVGGKTEVDNINRAIEKSRKTIIILTKKYLKANWATFQGAMAMHRVMKSGQQTIIPIVYNDPKLKDEDRLRDEDIPVKLSMLNYIYADREHFEERLLSAFVADISLTDAMPAGNVAIGLAWSYFYGYLNMILRDLPGRIERCEEIWHKDPNNRRTCRKMFIMIPKSCFCPAKFGDADDRISDAGQLETYFATRAGNIKRPYPAFAKKITMKDEKGEDDVYYFVGEFATPILSMYEMERERIAGLSQKDKDEQVVTFYRTLKDILNHKNAEHCHNRVILHFFDDAADKNEKQYPLADRLVEMIKESIQNETNEEKDEQQNKAE